MQVVSGLIPTNAATAKVHTSAASATKTTTRRPAVPQEGTKAKNLDKTAPISGTKKTQPDSNITVPTPVRVDCFHHLL